MTSDHLRGFERATGRFWRKAANLPKCRLALVGPKTESRRSKGHQRGTGRVDNVGLCEAVAPGSNASRAVGSYDLLKTSIAVTAIWFIGSDAPYRSQWLGATLPFGL
jgi:hypothetical protein